MQKPDLLLLYRNIIRHAKIFPSKNRLGILKEIREEFRMNKNLTDEHEIRIEIEKAQKGLSQLSMYTNLRTEAGPWVINLEKEPMPRPKK